jgi:hypothetical protein
MRIDDCGAPIDNPILNLQSIPNRQSNPQYPISNPIRNPQSPIQSAIDDRQSAIGWPVSERIRR